MCNIYICGWSVWFGVSGVTAQCFFIYIVTFNHLTNAFIQSDKWGTSHMTTILRVSQGRVTRVQTKLKTQKREQEYFIID